MNTSKLFSNYNDLIIKLRQILTHKILRSYGLPILVLLLFHKSIEEVINLLIVIPILSKIGSTGINNILFMLASIYVCVLFLTRIVSFVPSGKAFLLQLVICTVYLYYRCNQDVWVFYSLKGFEHFYYIDIIFEIALFNGLLILRQSMRKKTSVEGKGFDDDSSLGKSKPDLLGYESYVSTLALRIKQSHPEAAMAVGINGRWGSGKTSFLDLLKRNMVKEPVIVIDFDPWNSLSPKAIIKDFFDTVQRAIKPYHSQLPNLLNTYTDKLISLHNEGWGKFANELKSIVASERSLNDLYEQINNEIKAIDRKILIYIDDLDRLDKEEIAEVIRLIRNTASFSNTFFIVAYDRDYVLSAIKAMKAFNHNHFLEKIFQIEVNLPYFNPDIIQRKLADLLKAYYAEDYHRIIEKEIIDSPSAHPNYFEGWIKTLRDVTRLSNGIKLNLDQLLTEVVFSEFVCLEILRLKYPSVYEVFYKRHTAFLQIDDKYNGTNGYQLKKIGDTRGEPFRLTKDHTEFELFIRQNNTGLSVEPQEITAIVDLIASIFGVDKLISKRRSHLSVVHPSRFPLYFAYSMIEGKLSEEEFLKATEGDLVLLKKQIDTWNDSNLNFEVLRRFMQIKSFNDRKHFETVVEGIFYFARQSDNDSQYGFEDRQLADLLDDNKKKLSRKFYQGNEGEYIAFVRRIISGATYPYLFDAGFLEHLNKDITESFPIQKPERLQMVQKLFYDFTQDFKDWGYNLWRLYHACSYKEWTPTGASSFQSETIYPDEANQIMINTISKHLESFLPAIIDFPPFVQDHMFISPVIREIFGSFEAFGDFLDNYGGESTYALTEFGAFYQELAKVNFERAVPFDFKTIKVTPRGQVT